MLSGMNNQKQVEENIHIASGAEANSLSQEELALFDKVKEILSQSIKVNCTACGYCMPCPAGVDIHACFSIYNEKYLLKTKHYKMNYMQILVP